MVELVVAKTSFYISIENSNISINKGYVFCLAKDKEIIENIELSSFTLKYNKPQFGVEVYKPSIPYFIYEDKPIFIFGYISNDNEITFFNDYDNETLSGNIEITFPIDLNVYDEKGNILYSRKDLINKCTFGILYTDNYSQNRLVISGNELEKNCDWWNDDINVFATLDDINRNKNLKHDDLMYFPDENYCYYGTNKTAVVAYAVDSNGKLVVFKEHKDNLETTIFFREAVYEDNRYILNMYSGNTGSAPYNHNQICNFNGNIIFIDNNKTLQQLITSSNLNDTSKYSQTISSVIDGYIKEYDFEDFKNARINYLNDSLYFLIGSDIFVGRPIGQYVEFFRFTSSICEKNNFKEIEIIDNNIFLLNDRGEIYIFNDNNDYLDTHIAILNKSEFTESGKDLVISKDRIDDLEENDEVKFHDSFLGIELFDENLFELDKVNNIVKCKNNDFIKFLNYVSNDKCVFNAIEKKCSLEKIDYDTFKLVVIDDNNFSLSNCGYFAIYIPTFKLEEDKYIHFYIKNIDKANNKCQVFYKDFQVNFLFGVNKRATFNRKLIVNAFYITKPFDFGTLNQFKNIHAFTLTNDTPLSSSYNVSIISNNVPKLKGQIISMSSNKILNTRYSLSLNDYDFTNLSLSQSYVPTRGTTIYRNIFRQKYFCFVFSNNDENNMVLSKFSAIYSYGGNIVGGD